MHPYIFFAALALVGLAGAFLVSWLYWRTLLDEQFSEAAHPKKIYRAPAQQPPPGSVLLRSATKQIVVHPGKIYAVPFVPSQKIGSASILLTSRYDTSSGAYLSLPVEEEGDIAVPYNWPTTMFAQII